MSWVLLFVWRSEFRSYQPNSWSTLPWEVWSLIATNKLIFPLTFLIELSKPRPKVISTVRSLAISVNTQVKSDELNQNSLIISHQSGVSPNIIYRCSMIFLSTTASFVRNGTCFVFYQTQRCSKRTILDHVHRDWIYFEPTTEVCILVITNLS